jgi:hypothetical protein
MVDDQGKKWRAGERRERERGEGEKGAEWWCEWRYLMRGESYYLPVRG